MVSKKDNTWVLTGTTRDKDLVESVEAAVELNPDMTEARLVREAVREYVE